MSNNIASPRYPLRAIDLLKVIAAQCIVLHHFSAYGPLSEAAGTVLPSVWSWFYNHARMAVQIFLVVSGYLAARSLSFNARPFGDVASDLVQRYLRLALPFMVALALTVACSAWARPYLEGEVVPQAPTITQLLAHLGLLHSVLDVESLSAGVWYVAIDFQLYALLALLLWVSRGQRALGVALVAVLCVASLTWFNLDAGWDAWAVYFFGAYGLGAMAWWAGLRGRHGTLALGVYLLTLGVGLASLLVHFRERIALAISVSVVLYGFGAWRFKLPRWADEGVALLSRTSYSLFLVHFAVLLLANSLWVAADGDGAGEAILFLVAAWMAAMAGSMLFHEHVEQRLAKWRGDSGVFGVLQALRRA